MSVVASSVGMYITVSKLTDQVGRHERELETLRNDIAAVKAASVTRTELLETMKRVEQQLEIMMLRGQRGKIGFTQ